MRGMILYLVLVGISIVIFVYSIVSYKPIEEGTKKQ